MEAKQSLGRKKELRSKLLGFRNSFDVKYVGEASDAICKKLRTKIICYDYLFLYNSFGKEISLSSLFNNKNIALPVVSRKKMFFRLISENTSYQKNKYGIDEPTSGEIVEPTESSIIILPSLALTKEGERLGYGGGYYDRYLSGHNCKKIGVCYKEFIVNSVFSEEHDIKVDEIITN